MQTSKFSQLFEETKPLIGMIHVQALPGTPNNRLSVSEIVKQSVNEANTLIKAGVQSIMLENMHDIPYLKRKVGPEIVASMASVAAAVRSQTDLPMGVQILAGANQAAISVALAAGFQYIRAEGFVFGHLADEGILEADAGDLLRFRKHVGAEHIQIFTDIKKKHSSHAITADISLKDTVEAAEFFQSDGVIITGTHTGKAVSKRDLEEVYPGTEIPVLVGSGVTPQDLAQIWENADGFIVGSYFKKGGDWKNEPDPKRLDELVKARESLLK